MAEERVQRRLAAILAADVVGYSRLVEQDERETLDRFRTHRQELFEPEVGRHSGRIFKLTGDGFLAEFASVVDAVECAVALQREMAARNQDGAEGRRMDVRLAVNLGDVIVEGEDRLGEGVIIAARLEALADPGGILISGPAFDQVRNKTGHRFEDRGTQVLKNIAEPVRVYRIAGTLPPAAAALASTVALNKPSIAVLPFTNMSGDPEQEYFSDGITEDIITELSRFHSLIVIARNSSFTYKGMAVGVKQVARELGVRYVLEGSVRKTGGRVRISGQLIDASTSAHLWADRFDGKLEDIFDLQDQVTTSVVGAIAPKLEQAEIERAKRKPTNSLNAYDYFLRGLASFRLFTQQENDKALRLFLKAIKFDRGYASALGMATWCYQRRLSFGWAANRERDGIAAMRLARRAVAMGKDDPVALYSAGFTFVHVAHDVEGGAALIERALQLNPNDAVAWGLSGLVHAYLGIPVTAIEHVQRGMRLSPLDPFFYFFHSWLARGQFVAARYEEAAASAEKALRGHPDHLSALLLGTAVYALLGRLDEARRLLAHLRALHPHIRVSTFRDIAPFQRPADLAAYEEGLRNAGLLD
jgi:TolB-like protein/tetratricopeptide (TPR) repeat protein